MASLGSRALNAQHPACAQNVLTNVVIPGSMSTIAVNSALNKIYISDGYSPASITVMDGTMFSEATIGAGTGGQSRGQSAVAAPKAPLR